MYSSEVVVVLLTLLRCDSYCSCWTPAAMAERLSAKPGGTFGGATSKSTAPADIEKVLVTFECTFMQSVLAYTTI